MIKACGRTLVVSICCFGACSKPVDPTPQAKAPTPVAILLDARPPAQVAAVPAAKTSNDEELQAEDREADPGSASVKIRINVSPAVDAAIFWGGKKLGVAGKKTLELERPRGSGPLDVVIRATGFLPYHTRLLTDRDDKISVRLIRPEEAPGMLGYRRPATPLSP